ncbi:phosphoadenosine phosphosulfate reductase family protein [Lutibacter sp. B2]|nr:phosphoadenosine phosphosulfate reductase family protein [Lutibacter sp. B2]
MRQIISLSGGKDSTALAVYLTKKNPNIKYEYVFCDTGCELLETYVYLTKIEKALGIDIVRLNSDKPFEFYLEKMNGYLPSVFARWCTREMKIKPWERYVGDDKVYSYVGIRADEDRKGYISSKKNIHTIYPFIEDGICIKDVEKILLESKIGYPSYYQWRSRSGCYFCMFQRRIEWVNLYKYHPKLFKKALAFEKDNFTWIKGMSLLDLLYRGKEIEERYYKKYSKKDTKRGLESEDDDGCCLICSL